MTTYDTAREAAGWIRGAIGDVPDVALILGSGLGTVADALEGAVSIPYARIPHWPPSGVVGHDGRLVAGALRGRRALALAGRAHLYEGHSPQAVTFATRVLGVLGVKTLLLTNAAGGVNALLPQGALMIVDDHLNLTGTNPLAGPHDERFGARFPDMSEVYSSRLRAIADDVARDRRVAVHHGVYAGLLGPSYETPAEIRYLRTIGADAVGMSTVSEAIVARQMGMEVLAISCITNMAAGVLTGPVAHEDVVAVAGRVGAQFLSLLEGIVDRL
jgi:purine-nucleoside phosphorylase